MLALVRDGWADGKLFRYVQRLGFSRLRIEQLLASLGLGISRILDLDPVRRRPLYCLLRRVLPLRVTRRGNKLRYWTLALRLRRSSNSLNTASRKASAIRSASSQRRRTNLVLSAVSFESPILSSTGSKEESTKVTNTGVFLFRGPHSIFTGPPIFNWRVYAK